MMVHVKKASREIVLMFFVGTFVFVFALITTVILQSIAGYWIYKRYGLLKAFTLSGIILFVVMADRFVQGRQDYLRAIIFSYQAVLMILIYKGANREMASKQ